MSLDIYVSRRIKTQTLRNNCAQDTDYPNDGAWKGWCYHKPFLYIFQLNHALPDCELHFPDWEEVATRAKEVAKDPDSYLEPEYQDDRDDLVSATREVIAMAQHILECNRDDAHAIVFWW